MSKTPIDLGERIIATSHGYDVSFSPTSTIIISNDDNEVSLDPTDLSAIYGAYMQMQRELNGDVPSKVGTRKKFKCVLPEDESWTCCCAVSAPANTEMMCPKCKEWCTTERCEE